VAQSWAGTLAARLGAHPVRGGNLTLGMLLVVPVLAVGCFFFFVGARYLQADQERAERPSGNAPLDADLG
jgi:hypothetical protein